MKKTQEAYAAGLEDGRASMVAEIERMKAENENLSKWHGHWHSEAARLRAALEEIKGKYAWQTEAGAIARETLNEQLKT